jgi:hypothetical protein
VHLEKNGGGVGPTGPEDVCLLIVFVFLSQCSDFFVQVFFAFKFLIVTSSTGFE